MAKETDGRTCLAELELIHRSELPCRFIEVNVFQ